MSNLYLLQKAENTLKRADDLIEGGQSKIAFQELQTILSNVRLNKSRQWSEILEEVTLKCVTLAVELRSSSEAKQVLLYYKSICGLDHPQSIDKVLKHYVEMAEKSAKSAQAQSNTESLSLQKDLEDEVPENILMSEVSGEDLKDRKDREIVTPWLKFLWETYRTVLDLLKISPSKELQTRYHDTAHRAFKFCRDYKRILEFKRLSEMLRTHLTQIKLTYTKDSPYAKINVSNAETLQQFLDTRFKQLDVASELELYNEAYKSIEDIYSLMKLSKKAIDPNLMAKYCEHLSKIFWVSENYVLHSFAHYKLFNLKNASKQKEEKDLQLLASTLLLSALSIPSKHQSDDIVDVNFNEREKLQRMSLLLGLSVAPSKQMLLSEIVKKQVMSFVYPELKNIYTILEVDFHPLQLCAKITPALNYLKEHSQLKQYVKPLQQIVLSKLLLQLSKVYEVVKLSELAKLAPFVSLPQIERAIVSAVQQRTLQITIDHQNSALIFGKSVEPFDSEQIRNELTKLAQKLSHATYTMINPSLKQTETATYEKSVVSSLSKAEQEHLALLERKQLIEKKKIYIDNMKREQEELKEQRQREMAKQKEIAEKLQQEKQQQKREEEMRRRREEEEKREQQVKLIKELEQAGVVTEQTISAIAAKTGKKKSKLDIERDVDVETIMEVKREEIVKEQREKERKLLEEAKNLDYLERARRMEEIPMLKKRFEQQRHEDRESHEKSVKEAEQKFTKHIEEMKSQRALLEKMFSDKNVFATNFVMKKREEVYEQKISVYNQEVEKARQVWLKKREAIKAVVDKLEEEKREKQRQREEEDRRRQEEQDKIRRERDAERERLQRQSDIQAQKEREMEEAARLKREQLIGASRQQQQQPSRSTRWGTLEQESTSFGGRRRFDDDQPPRRRFDDEQPPRRRFDDEQPPRRRFDDNQGPPRRFDDNQGPPRRFDDEQPPRRRFDDNQAPPRKRFDDEPKRNDSTGGSGRWR